ncbi:hypothetical protein ABIB25_004178 [Nakamurella sp. UYEF19]|uniref:hypothetical protein n=1 Tax=Nakamurella sp. UYEF19 TaxID=1756392 RepID=UPI0033962193
MTTLTYSFGDSQTPTETYSSAADVDVNGDGHVDGVYLDFDGSGHHDSIAWDSDGDGKVDTILVSSHHDGVYDTAYYDPSGNGHWDAAEPFDGPPAAEVEPPADHSGASTVTLSPDTADQVLTYSFGDSSTPTHTYTGEAHVDVNGDGHPDGLYLDFDGSGHHDSIAWDSNGDGKVDTILVSSHHDGVYDTAYHDPSGDGHWNEADAIHGDVTSAGAGASAATPPPDHGTDTPPPASAPDTPDLGTDDGSGDSDHTWVVGSDDDPFAHVATSADEPAHQDFQHGF